MTGEHHRHHRVPGQRIAVVGTSGSGKTTTAHQLARKLEVPHIELDALHWGPDWTLAPLHVFRERVAEALRGGTWVVDGNYSKVRDIVWSRADTIVWLDYHLAVILWRLAGRTLRRAFRHEELWRGNRESLRRSLFSRDSILLWALRSYRRRRRDYPELLRRVEYAHLSAMRLHSPSATRKRMSRLAPGETEA